MTRAAALPILQSGFVALPGAGVVRPGERRDPFTDYTLNQAWRRNAQDGFYLPEITEIHQALVDTPAMVKCPDWNLRLIRAMYECLGPDFVAWLKLQANQPTVGTAQINFIKDTIHYLKHGRRTMSTLGHLAAMARDTSGGGTSEGINKLLNEFANSGAGGPVTVIYDALPRRVEDLYTVWLNHRNGVDDLAETLYLIFGCRKTPNTFQDKLG